MRPIVVDASAVAEYLLRTGRAAGLEETLLDDDVELHVPALCDVELAAVLRRALLERRMTLSRAEEALLDYRDLPLTRHGHVNLIERAIELRENISAYDAIYIALAERLGAEFVTSDERLAQAARTHTSLDVLSFS